MKSIKINNKSFYEYSLAQQCLCRKILQQFRKYQWMRNLKTKYNLIKNEFG